MAAGAAADRRSAEALAAGSDGRPAGYDGRGVPAPARPVQPVP